MNAGDHVVIQVTQMDPYNIAICFAPNLCPIPEGYDQMQFTNHVRLSVLFICFLEVCICIYFFLLFKSNNQISFVHSGEYPDQELHHLQQRDLWIGGGQQPSDHAFPPNRQSEGEATLTRSSRSFGFSIRGLP